MGKKVTRNYPCRFNCKKRAYHTEDHRNNHETNCQLNPNKGQKAQFKHDGKKYIYEGIKK